MHANATRFLIAASVLTLATPADAQTNTGPGDETVSAPILDFVRAR